MKREDLFACMNGIDDKLLLRSERSEGRKAIWKTVLPMAACLCLLITALLLPGLADPVLPDRPTLGIEPKEPLEWLPVYNSGSSTDVNANFREPPGLFREDLSGEKLSILTPSVKMDWMHITGRGYYLNDGTPYYYVLDITTRGNAVQLIMGEYNSCVIYDESSAQITRFGDVEYRLYKTSETRMGANLEATAYINEVPMHFNMRWAKDEDLADFETVLQCFALYTEGKPSLSDVPPDRIPEYFDREPTLTEAYEDELFGKYLPEAVSQEMTAVHTERYRDGDSDWLTVNWSTPAADTYLEWNVSKWYAHSRVEADAEELTLEFLEEDLNRGDYTSTYVRFGDMVLRVQAKNIPAQWVYDQLLAIRERTGNLE